MYENNFRRKVGVGDINLGVVRVQPAFNTLKLGERNPRK